MLQCAGTIERLTLTMLNLK